MDKADPLLDQKQSSESQKNDCPNDMTLGRVWFFRNSQAFDSYVDVRQRKQQRNCKNEDLCNKQNILGCALRNCSVVEVTIQQLGYDLKQGKNAKASTAIEDNFKYFLVCTMFFLLKKFLCHNHSIWGVTKVLQKKRTAKIFQEFFAIL